MTDIICRWRDAITDPPEDGWEGLIKNTDEGRIVWFRDYRGKHYPGDQWLDVTDVPAVAVAKVQAAVDELWACLGVPAKTTSAEDYDDGMYTSLRTVQRHTGITPSEVPHD